jgi:LuxR family maltose regulon positive regulatory protein
MESTLLATKLRIPEPARHLLRRAHLVEALEAAVSDGKLTLVTAPAGYGKTALLAQWAHASRFPVAWLSLGADENDPDRFFRYLLAAWEEVQPGLRQSSLGLLLGAADPDREAVLTALLNVANALPTPIALVLDDFHVIDEPAIHAALTFLLDHLPPTLHIVIAGRREPPLPLARYRARGEARDMGPEDLRFAGEETHAFLRHMLPDQLSDDAIAAIQERLEGWPAGLWLVCYAISRRPDAARSLTIGGRHRFIADYLDEEVLTNLDDATRQFLVRTSILDQLNGELCNAVTGGSQSQRLLETLERDGLFLRALDETREWFRSHPIFADVLREKLQQDHAGDVPALHCRAAHWYLDHAMPELAFRHAVAGNDVDLVMHIGEDYSVIKMESGELNVVARWIQMIPGDWFATYPLFDLLRVMYLIYTGAFAESLRLLETLEDRLQRSRHGDRRAQLGKVATVRCAIACFENDLPAAESLAAAALRDLPADAAFYRAGIYHALGETYSRNARWEEARATLLEALRVVHGPSWLIRAVHIYGALADLELRRGRLEEAERYWDSALEAIQQRELWGRLPIPVTGWVFIRKGEISYERNRLPEASDFLRRGLELAELGGDVRSLIAGSLLSARLRLTAGELESAADDLERAHLLLEQAPLPEWQERQRRCQLELWLAQDRLRAVAHWADGMAPDGHLMAGEEPGGDGLTFARALIAKGTPADRRRAHAVLRQLADAAAAHGRTGMQIEAFALQALALWGDGDRAGALTSLERALRVAEPEGYARVFADLGLPMARVLQEARARKLMPDYVQTILAAFAMSGLSEAASPPALAEPLSEREREVLALMAAGLTNREIGEALFISAETVKKHSGNIYAKLHAGNRTEAVARARSLGILDDAR